MKNCSLFLLYFLEKINKFPWLLSKAAHSSHKKICNMANLGHIQNFSWKYMTITVSTILTISTNSTTFAFVLYNCIFNQITARMSKFGCTINIKQDFFYCADFRNFSKFFKDSSYLKTFKILLVMNEVSVLEFWSIKELKAWVIGR